MRRIYLDYNASTPIDPTVAALMRPFLEDHYGNPSSGHWASIEAKVALEIARGQVATLLGCHNDEIVFTSGGSEANNLALKGVFFALATRAITSSPRSFGRMNRIRPCWAPIGTRPAVPAQFIREYIYLYGAVAPKDGTCVYLIMPTSNTACFQVFLDVLARKFARQDILLVLDGAPNHRCGDLVVPDNVTLLYLPPYSPELNPKENLWDEIREKIFKNYALKSMDAVRAKLRRAILYMERNPKLIRSITSFPYIVNSL